MLVAVRTYVGPMRKLVVLVGLVVAGSASADGPRKTAPAKLVGSYHRKPGEGPAELTADKGSTCGDEARDALRKVAERVSRVVVQPNAIKINTGAPNPLTLATDVAVIANVVAEHDARFTSAFRFMVLEAGALTVTYNKVERETADWCSDTWGVELVKD